MANTPTFEEMMALFQETRNMISEMSKETEQQIKALNLNYELSLKAREEERKALEAERSKDKKEMDKMLKELGSQIGGIGNKFGKFTEGLMGESIRRILRDLGAERVTGRYEIDKSKDLEIDYLGLCNGKVNKVFVVEVKSNLKDEHINQILKIVKKFRELLPEFKDKKVIGLVAAVQYTDEQYEKILKEGLYFINISNEVAKLNIPDNFKPKIY